MVITANDVEIITRTVENQIIFLVIIMPSTLVSILLFPYFPWALFDLWFCCAYANTWKKKGDN